MKPLLLIPVGPPGTGKSTYGRRLLEAGLCEYVSRDLIRKQFGDYTPPKEQCVLQVMKGLIQGHLLNGKNVFVDCNNVTIRDRALFHEWAKELWDWTRLGHQRVALYFPGSYEESVARVVARGDDKFPEEFIQKQYARLVVPTESEEFKVVYIRDARTDSLELIQV